MNARGLAIVAALLSVTCAESESEREERAAQKAIPQRVQADGTIRLTDADRKALDLEVVPATEGELPEIAVRFGRVRSMPGEETVVVSPVAGRIAQPPAVQLGAPVHSGAALLEIIPVLGAAERISVNVKGAEIRGQIEALQTELATRQAALERANELAQSKIVSEAKLQEAETAVATTRAHVEALRRASTLQTRGEGAPMTLRASKEGTVVTLNASVGAVVQQGDLLVRILKAGPRWVDVSMAPSEPPGERYEVAAGSTWMPARLTAAGGVIDDDGIRRDRLQIEAPEAVNLVPGQTLSVRVARGLGRGIVLSEAAIVPGVQTDLVFVETAAGTFAPRPVHVIARFEGRVRLSAGLRVGERVVTRGVMSLHGESRRSELRRVD